MEKSDPDYKNIYSDIIAKKYPHKKDECKTLLNKDKLSVLDIIKLNHKIFGSSKESEIPNQQLRCYNKTDIINILEYQKKYKLNNTQLALYFKLSRNSVAKWKNIFNL